jgi:hypothetical protein
MLEGACNIVKELQQPPGEEDDFPVPKKGGLERLVRRFASTTNWPFFRVSKFY